MAATLFKTDDNEINERRWVIQMKGWIEEDEDYDDNYGIASIFNIPNFLLAHKPDVYTPQLISLGPYHHCRPELHHMDRYKLAAAKNIRVHLKTSAGVDFHHLVDRISKMEHRIRCSYHRYLDHDADYLAWMMAIDGCFIVDFLHVHAAVEGNINVLPHVSTSWSRSVRNAVLRDTMMLENQIPLFLLRAVMEESITDTEMADEMLGAMLTNFCKEIVPFKGAELKIGKQELAARAHLLDLLYHIIIQSKSAEVVIEIIEQGEEIDSTNVDDERDSNGKVGRLCLIKNCFLQILGNIARRFLLFVMNTKLSPLIKKIIRSNIFLSIIKIPFNIFFALPVLSLLREPLLDLLFNAVNNENNDEAEKENAPLIEEITIPSVTELHAAGVTFKPTKLAELSSISFDRITATLHLPTVKLDENTEVVLRNLVAYESMTASGPLVLARYTELMNGIIDGEEDVRLLREKGILENRLKSDGEVADLWNGMSKSVRLTKVPILEKVIEDVNKYHRGKWKVKVQKIMKKHVFSSWRSLSLLGMIMLLFMSALQAFCSIYGCVPKHH